MRIGAAFPSKYLKAADLPDGQYVRVTMDHVAVENVAGNNDPEDEKPVLYFRGKQKGMVLNRTNSNTISAVYGDETDDWSGKPILLYSAETQFQGKTMPCLRVKVEKGGQASRPAPQPIAAAALSPISEEKHFEEDDIPF